VSSVAARLSGVPNSQRPTRRYLPIHLQNSTYVTTRRRVLCGAAQVVDRAHGRCSVQQGPGTPDGEPPHGMAGCEAPSTPTLYHAGKPVGTLRWSPWKRSSGSHLTADPRR
jgi:hypothetical protein